MYAAYLRKSREDLNIEKFSGIDTLQRHRDIIKKTAEYMNIQIEKWYEEVVSGETIEARPKVQEMLLEVEQGHFAGVLVVDIDRLARGDTADQSRISKAFSFSATKIITPTKIYDPENEADEEYFEFNLFMSRREYKTINKRLNRGRLSSVNEGKFVGSICPFGYSKEKLRGQKGYKLIVNEDEAKIVKIIFDLACNNTGACNIANHLNKIGVKPRKADVWTSATIRDIIHNPVYFGMIKWNHRKVVKTMKNGIVYKTRPKQKDYTLVKGLHEPILSKEKWELANKNSKIKEGKSTKKSLTLQNPLAGLVECAVCGRTMQRRNYRSGHIDGLICTLPHCKNIGSHLYLVEKAVLSSIQEYLQKYEQTLMSYQKEQTTPEIDTNNIELIDKELEKLQNQLNKAYDLLEQEIYDNNIFIERSNQLKSKIQELKLEKEKCTLKSKKATIEKIKNVIPKLQNVINNYSISNSAEERNNLLKTIINRIYYIKIRKGIGHEDEFDLKIDIKL